MEKQVLKNTEGSVTWRLTVGAILESSNQLLELEESCLSCFVGRIQMVNGHSSLFTCTTDI